MYSISIIIPTYNPDNYLIDCVQSLYNQSLNKKNFEIIIVLNGEIDKYRFFLNEIYISKPNEVNLTILESLLTGVSSARNFGLDNASGKYITFLDDDDILSPNYLETMLSKVESSSIVVSNVYSFYNELDENIIDYLSYKKLGNSIIQRRKYLSNACCKLIPRDIICTKRFNVNFKNGEDALFMFSISNNIKQIIIEKNCIYYRRLRPNSASRKKISFISRIKRIVKQQLEYTKIYFSNPCEYNFVLYLSRLLAVYKQ